MADTSTHELLQLNQKLLEAIASADWKTYEELCDPSLTCFEPEAMGQLVEGLAFHRFYFQFPGASDPCNTTMASPHLRVMGDVAIVSYVRLNQRTTEGVPSTQAVAETRVWHKKNGAWKHVHFHRSEPRTQGGLRPQPNAGAPGSPLPPPSNDNEPTLASSAGGEGRKFLPRREDFWVKSMGCDRHSAPM